jgi:hypothetical protein
MIVPASSPAPDIAALIQAAHGPNEDDAHETSEPETAIQIPPLAL